MKIRSHYVSNSSSSSFIIAYDQNTFGDLNAFFKNEYLGCNTYINDVSNIDDFCSTYVDNRSDQIILKNAIRENQQLGKSICWVHLDSDYKAVINLLKNISKCDEGKLLFLYDTSKK